MGRKGNKTTTQRRTSGVKTRLQKENFIKNNQVNQEISTTHINDSKILTFTVASQTETINNTDNPENFSDNSSLETSSQNSNSTDSSLNNEDSHSGIKMSSPKPQMLVGLITCFDGTKNTNIDNFLLQAEDLLNKTDYSPEDKVTILKCKITSLAKEKLMKDLSLFNETNLETFKTKLRLLFKPKLNFSSAQSQFNSVKQKPGQNLTDFLLEFNFAADQMIKIAGDEADSNKMTDQLKLSNFLKAIRSDISNELRKTCPTSFQEACATALKLEEGFSQTEFFEINNIQVQQNSETLNTLIKIHSETSEQVQSLVAEVNNLKLKLNTPYSKSEEKFCTFCKKKSHYVEQCWKKNGNRQIQTDNLENKKSFQNYTNNPQDNYRDNNFQAQRPNFQNQGGTYQNFGNYASGYQNYPPPGFYPTPYSPHFPYGNPMGDYYHPNSNQNYQTHHSARHNGFEGKNTQYKKRYRNDQFTQKDSNQTENNENKNRTGSNDNKQQHKNNANKAPEN